jgi:glycosyltransferase involved in cell wall biosynthesis
MSLRVLLAVQSRLIPGDGPSGATQTLGAALADQGCSVEYFGYENAFGHDTLSDSLGSELKFPWRLAAFLRRRAKDLDVLDVSTGCSWVWSHRRRPGTSSPVPALITRSHGLEHTADQWRRADAAAGQIKLNWKYPLYHGGFRLWEVRQSLLHCDHALLLNEFDRQFAINELCVPESLTSVMAHGIDRQFLGLPEPSQIPIDAPLKLAAVGKWIDRKGRRTIVELTNLVQQQGVPFVLTLLGTGLDEVQVRTDFAPAVRSKIRVIPSYHRGDFPRLMTDQHILLSCSYAETYALTIPEAMACGTAPIATRVGGAPQLIEPGVNGELVHPGDAKSIAAIVSRWSSDRTTLGSVRHHAWKTAQHHAWNVMAVESISIYEQALRRVAGRIAPNHGSADTLLPARTNWQRNEKPTLSICICTANRPAVLRRCLASIDGSETAAVCGDFSFVRYLRGPRHGLCANRNVLIAAAQGQYIALLDDDAEVMPTFVRLAHELTARADGRTIFTGDVLQNGIDRVTPHNPTFLGHFGRPLSPIQPNETVQLNCNLFPRSAFNGVRFDERIIYGYEDMDVCQQMLATGHRIEYRPELVNLHLPRPKPADVRKTQVQQMERARYYTSLKRYLLWQSRPFRAFAYAALAPLHQAVHHLTHHETSHVFDGFRDMSWAIHQTLKQRRADRSATRSDLDR